MFLKNLIVVFCLVPLLALGAKPLDSAQLEIEPHPVLTIDDYIVKIFGDKAPIAKAVIFHESNNNLNAKNYNCRYNGKSTSCKKEDRDNAWSVDCGIAQINVRGKYCPASLLTLEGNMAATEKIYKSQGLTAWASYNNKKYLQFM